MKVIYATTVSDNKKDWECIRKGIVMCANDDSEILTATQYKETDPLSRRK